jgi:kynureninase
MYNSSLDYALNEDWCDKLKHFRDKFYIPQKDGKPVLYFAGNSLGLQPKSTGMFISRELDDWAKLGVEGHFKAHNPWLNYHELLSDSMAEVIGALPSEVVIMNTLTVNLHLLFVSFYRPDKQRFKILIEPFSFPSDYYAVTSQIKFHGFDPAEALIELPIKTNEVLVSTDDILDLIEKEGDKIALLWLGGVNYYTGQAFELEKISTAAHSKGIIVGLDLAHAAGNLLLKLHDWNIDFAAWCSYKYLNAGPGGAAGIYVHQHHHKNDYPKFAGWWGHDKSSRFKMEHEYIPIETAEQWQLSNPPIFQLAALKASLDIFREAGIQNLRDKSIKLSGYLEYLIKLKTEGNIDIITPEDPEQRGCQLSLRLKNNGREIFNKLSGLGIYCDWREPDVIRCAPVPLYNSFQDVYYFVKELSILISSYE